MVGVGTGLRETMLGAAVLREIPAIQTKEYIDVQIFQNPHLIGTINAGKEQRNYVNIGRLYPKIQHALGIDGFHTSNPLIRANVLTVEGDIQKAFNYQSFAANS